MRGLDKVDKYKKEKLTTLIVSLLNVLLLTLGHAYNSQVLLWGAISVFSVSVMFSPKGEFLPLMLFYLPWSPVLKTNPHTFTFFSLVVPVVFLVIFFEGVKKKWKYKMQYIMLPLFFSAYTLSVKLLNSLSIHFSYLFFIMMLFFIPIYVGNYKKDIHFERCTLFLTTGILSACIAAEILMKYPHMLLYIDVYNWEQIGLVRLSGFYGDPNYYSAQILVAIAALLIILGKTTKKVLIALQITSIIALLYFGMLSVSKMFILCTAGLVVLWIFNLMIEKRMVTYKLGITAAVVTIVGIVTVSNLFSDKINLYLLRFGQVTDISSLTTGRSKLMGVYLNYLFSNIDKFFFGIGLSQDQITILLNTNNAHNTVIQIIYQIGISGSLLLLWWWKDIYQELTDKTRMEFSEYIYFFIMTFSVLLPWLSLDILYFDEFFYFTLLLFLSKNYISLKPNDSSCTYNY